MFWSSVNLTGNKTVVMVHNLGFDMHCISPWLIGKKCKVVARSTTKPITISVVDEKENPLIVLWDTLGMFAKNLEAMGAECGMPKLSGFWDYGKVRTPETPLSQSEIEYAERDIHVLFAYLGFFMRSHPLIEEGELARRASTKTGVVRVEREKLFGKAFSKTAEKSAGWMWKSFTQSQRPQSNDELWTMQACTRGGLAFTAQKWASVPLDFEDGTFSIVGYDAESQHPAQMVSHVFPRDFEKADAAILDMDLELVRKVSIEKLLEKMDKPFPVAFNAAIDVKNLRLKKGSIFELEGIGTLSNSRRGWPDSERSKKADYKDSWGESVEAFGKLVEAKEARLYMTELEWWLFNQVYDYDEARAIHGYETGRFCKPTDYAVLSVMHYFQLKRDFKNFMKTCKANENVRRNVPRSILESKDKGEIEDYYKVIKSKLNSLYGIEITNEVRGEQHLLPKAGIVQDTAIGIEDLPRFSKTWYQFGQRIVGWSRIAQVVNMLLVSEYSYGIINGDTDSFKMIVETSNIEKIENALSVYSQALESAKKRTCSRVAEAYPSRIGSIDGIGRYEKDLESFGAVSI